MVVDDLRLAARTWAGFLIRAARHKVSPSERRIRRGLSNSAPLPRLKRGGPVWAISMVRDEADIIEVTVRHLIAQGVDRVLIADNGSIDGTRDILYALERDLPVTVVDDREPAYHQSIKMTRMAVAARQAGARWIVPFDADELWFADAGTLGDRLRGANVPKIEVNVHNVYPDDAKGSLYVDLVPEAMGKMAFRPVLGNTVLMGNHYVDRPGAVGGGLSIFHLPWRSKEQMRRKAAQGSLALRLAAHDAELGAQWTALGSGSEEVLDRAWSSLLTRNPLPALKMNGQGPFVATDLAALLAAGSAGVILNTGTGGGAGVP